MATAGQQGAAPYALFARPLIAGNITHNPVEIVGLRVLQFAHEVLLNLLGGDEQGVVVENIAHQRLDSGLAHRLIHSFRVLPGEGHRLFNQDVFPRLGSQNGLLTVHIVWRADDHNVYIGVL